MPFPVGAGLTARLPGDQDLEKVLEQQSTKASTGLLRVELGLSTDPAVEGAPGAGPQGAAGEGEAVPGGAGSTEPGGPTRPLAGPA